MALLMYNEISRVVDTTSLLRRAEIEAPGYPSITWIWCSYCDNFVFVRVDRYRSRRMAGYSRSLWEDARCVACILVNCIN